MVLVGSPYRLSGCAAAAVVTAGRGRGRWSGAVDTPACCTGSRLASRWRDSAADAHESAPTFTLPEAGFESTIEKVSTPEEVHHVQTL